MEKVFIVLNWCHDGDGYLGNSFESCFKTMEEAKEFSEKYVENSKKFKKIFYPGEEIPSEDGHHSLPGFLQIIEYKF